jgi:TRAP-type C4-dicarboxylate transport system permease small subunit
MNSLVRILDRVTSALGYVAGVAVVLMMIHITMSVITRYFFSYAPPGTTTIVSNYYMVIVVCLPLAFVERMEGHIAVDVFTNLLPRRLQQNIFGWTHLYIVVVLSLICYASWVEATSKYAIGQFSMEQDLQIPTWIGYFAVPFGYGLATVYSFLKFIKFVTGRDWNSKGTSEPVPQGGPSHD